MNEMANLLRSILKEELNPVYKRLDCLEQSLEGLELSMNKLKVGQDTIQKNIIHNIALYTEEIAAHLDDKTSALNKRIFNVETMIERIIKQ